MKTFLTAIVIAASQGALAQEVDWGRYTNQIPQMTTIPVIQPTINPLQAAIMRDIMVLVQQGRKPSLAERYFVEDRAKYEKLLAPPPRPGTKP